LDQNNKILIVTYYWPPAGGPGVQRWLKFVKYLPDLGYDPVVFVPENPSYPMEDLSLIDALPATIQVVKFPIVEPYRWAHFLSKKSTQAISAGIIPSAKKQSWIEKSLLWIRGNFFIPDARILWVKPASQFLEKFILDHHIQTVITTGPPHSVHLIGLTLKNKLPIRWIADFRDPWTTIGYHQSLHLSARSHKKHLDLENTVLQTADDLIVTSPLTKAEFALKTNQNIHVITNGYDGVDLPKVNLDFQFTIAHIGSFLSERNPRILWKVLKDLCLESADFERDFKLVLMGKVSQEILDTLTEFRLTSQLDLRGYVSHQDALIAQRQAQVLLLVEIDTPNTRCIIPGKLFEYMVSNRPILALGPEASDVAQIIQDTQTGCYFEYDTKAEQLKDVIWKWYQMYLEGKLNTHPIGLQQYARKSLTQALVKVIESN